MTSDDIRHMSAMDLLDMDYFLNDEDEDDVGEEVFYIFWFYTVLFCMPAYWRALLF